MKKTISKIISLFTLCLATGVYAQSLGQAPENTVCLKNSAGKTQCHDMKKLEAEKHAQGQFEKHSSIVYKYVAEDGSTAYSFNAPSHGIKYKRLDLNSPEMNDKVSYFH